MGIFILMIVIIVGYKLFMFFLSLDSKESRTKSYSNTTRRTDRYRSSDTSRTFTFKVENDNECYGDDEKLSNHFQKLENEGYRKVRIKGISFCNINRNDVGLFSGKAVAEINNEYDEYAIAIYKNGKRIGYAPAGSFDVHGYILLRGGSVDAFGYINGDRSSFWAEAYVEFNETEWAESLPIEDKIYARANLKKYIIEDYNSSVGYGVFEGKAIVTEGRRFPIEIYNNSKQKIGMVKDNMHLYYTLKIKENGKTDVWGLLKKNYPFVYIPVKCGPKKIANAKTKFEMEIKE